MVLIALVTSFSFKVNTKLMLVVIVIVIAAPKNKTKTKQSAFIKRTSSVTVTSNFETFS